MVSGLFGGLWAWLCIIQNERKEVKEKTSLEATLRALRYARENKRFL